MNLVFLPFKVVAVALELWWRNWVPLATTNLAWALCWLTLVLGPPATLAVYSVAGNLARGEDGSLSDFWRALRTYGLLAWRWFLPVLVGSLLLAASLIFYAQFETFWGTGLYVVTLMVGVLWLAVLFYAPLYVLEDPDKRVVRAYRNALFTALASPFYTLVLLLVSALVAAFSVGLVALLFLGGPCFIAVLGAVAVRDRLEAYGVKTRDGD